MLFKEKEKAYNEEVLGHNSRLEISQKAFRERLEESSALISHLQMVIEELRIKEKNLEIQIKEHQQAVPPGIVKDDLWRECRRYEGLFLQLKEQFQFKSSELDKARQELYASQEQVQACQKDQEEKYRLDRNDLEENYEKYIVKLENMRQLSEKRHSEEVEALHSIITYLST